MQFIYTWIPAYKSIVEKLAAYRNNQLTLIEILRNAGADSFNDKDESGNIIPLTNIDPFTFLCYPNKYGPVRRKQIHRNICEALEIGPLPKDFCGVPTADARRTWLFPYQGQRVNDEINRLWDFFEKLLADQLTDADFEDVLKINSVGKAKLSEVMYMAKPADYLCLNGVVKPYVKEKYNINPNFNTYSEFKTVCANIRSAVNMPFHEISYTAYLDSVFENRVPAYYRIGSTENGESRLDDMLSNNIVAIGWSDIGDIELINPLSKKGIQDQMKEIGYYDGNNATISRKAGEIWRFYDDLLPGDIIAVAEGQAIKAIGKVTSPHYIFEESLTFPHCHCVEWLKKDIAGLTIAEGILTSVWEFETPEAIAAINSYLEIAPSVSSGEPMPDPIVKSPLQLNTILFGPPGTGKTYKLQQIIKDWKLVALEEAEELSNEQFAENYSWWEILSLAVLDLKEATSSQIKSHPLVQAKFNIDNTKYPWLRLLRILRHYSTSHIDLDKQIITSLIFHESSAGSWRLHSEKEFRKSFPELVDAWNIFRNQNSPAKEVKKYLFTTCHQSLSYEDFIEGIKPKLVNGDTADDVLSPAQVQYEIRKGIFYKACMKACQLAGYSSLDECIQDSSDGRKTKFQAAIGKNNIMVLFLDEINRCNVSAVFGELITLIESDKRLGTDNEIADAILPYSQQLFGVPLNLYIIGTMNTADRSVDALDIALRRRFSFESMLPNAEVLKEEAIGEISLGSMLTSINERITTLLDHDHQIGHSYFWNIATETELKAVFNNKIIPLLQEYFYNDYGKIGLILGPAFVEAKQRNTKFPKGFLYDGQDELEEAITYTLIPIDKWTSKSFESIYKD